MKTLFRPLMKTAVECGTSLRAAAVGRVLAIIRERMESAGAEEEIR